MALVDSIGVASIMPFITLISDPQIIETNSSLNTLFTFYNFTNKNDFFIFCGLGIIFLLFISAVIRAYTSYAINQFSMMREFSISTKLLKIYLAQPYSFFLSHHSADLIKVLVSDVSLVINNGLLQMLHLISQFIIVFFIFLVLLYINIKLTLLSLIILISLFLMTFLFIKKSIISVGFKSHTSNEARFKLLTEIFGGIKELKVDGLERNYIDKFLIPAEEFAKCQGLISTIKQTPRFFLEAIIFGGVVVLILWLMSSKSNFISILPQITLFSLACYRIIPALQQIFSSFAGLKHSLHALDRISVDFNLNYPLKLNSPINQNIKKIRDTLKIKQNIKINNIYFSYPGTSRLIFSNLSLTIPYKKTTGIIGRSGSGKTTIADLILGLLQPHSGEILINGYSIDSENLEKWQNSIGYVPQQIFLADDTIERNIAFGLNDNLIDRTRIEKAAKLSNLYEFIVNELPEGFQTKLGERGVRLSGGQKQRVGIARALYKNPQILILDEATSALDNYTEQAVMDAVKNLNHKITILIIAHRITTIKNCDLIYVFEKGKIKAEGSYKKLIEENKI